jgi:hypothetical protein
MEQIAGRNMELPVTTKRSPRTWIIDLKCIVKVVAANVDKGRLIKYQLLW